MKCYIECIINDIISDGYFQVLFFIIAHTHICRNANPILKSELKLKILEVLLKNYL